MSKDFMCQASDGNSGEPVSLRSSIEPREETKWLSRWSASFPFQNWAIFEDDDLVEVVNANGETRIGRAGDFWWGYAHEVGQLSDGVIVKARYFRGQLEEQAASLRGDEVDAENKSASLTHMTNEELARVIADKFEYVGVNHVVDLAREISSALLTVQKQERERCANIADEHWKGTPSHQLKVCRDTCANIAASIRQGDDNAS